MFEPGDIVAAYSKIAGKRKYHLCVCGENEHEVIWFLFLSSRRGYGGDLVLSNDQVPCIPPNATGQTVIGCSQVIRMRVDELPALEAQRIGELELETAQALLEFVRQVPTLTGKEKRAIVAGLESYIDRMVSF